MWNSNSLTAWLLARSGHRMDAISPPAQGRAPGWHAGLTVAARQAEHGSGFVNEAVRSDPRLPFGGVKESGYGRELSGYGIKEFVNIKTVYVG